MFLSRLIMRFTLGLEGKEDILVARKSKTVSGLVHWKSWKKPMDYKS